MSVSTLTHNLDSASATFSQHADAYGTSMIGESYGVHVVREFDLTIAANYPVTAEETIIADALHHDWLADEVVIGGECSHPDAIIVWTYSREDNSHAGECLGCGERF